MNKSFFNAIKKYKHIWVLLYMPVYLYCFVHLEKYVAPHYTYIHCKLDDFIPFNEIFIIPYMSWFFYVAFMLIFLYFQFDHLEDYYRLVGCLIIGMSTCLVFYALWPSAQALRPETFPRDNFFTQMVAHIYNTDTPTNVCPSIHVYNSIAVHVALCKSHFFHNKKGWKVASLILCILICLSTMVLKQHSVIDVVCGGALYVVYYILIYKLLARKSRKK